MFHLRLLPLPPSKQPPFPPLHSLTTLIPSPPPPSSDDGVAAAKLILDSDPKSLPETLKNTTFQWNPSLVDKTLKRLWNHGPKALNFFNYLVRNRNYPLSSSSFNLAIDIAARMRDYKSVWALLSRMRACHVGPNPRTFAIITERYVSAGKADKAVKIFLSMHKHGCVQDLNCFNTILDVLCKSRRVEMAFDLFKVFRGRFKADCVSYNIIVNGFCLIKRTPKALEVMKEMVERGMSPSLVSYNILLKGYFRSGQLKEAWDFFLEMKKRKCDVDVVTYTTMVHGFGVVGEIERARKVFDEMVRDGVLPSVATYNALIQVLCKKDSVDNAILVFEEMLRKGYVPNSITYNLIIRGLCHKGDMQRAIEFMVRMEEDDECEPNVQTYNVVIRYFCDAGEIEKGLEMLEKMRKRSCLPNLDTYNILISDLFVRKKSDDLVLAGKLLMEMMDRGFLPRKFTLNRVLDGLLLTGNQDFAKEILRSQSSSGRVPRHLKL